MSYPARVEGLVNMIRGHQLQLLAPSTLFLFVVAVVLFECFVILFKSVKRLDLLKIFYLKIDVPPKNVESDRHLSQFATDHSFGLTEAQMLICKHNKNHRKPKKSVMIFLNQTIKQLLGNI